MEQKELTSVNLHSIQDRRNYRIVFGHPSLIVNDPAGTEAESWSVWFFDPSNIFCLDLFDRDLYGSTHWSVYVLQAARPGETITPVPQVTPGAKVLLEAHGKKRAQEALRELKEIQERVDPTTLPPGRFLLTDFRLKADTRTRR